MKQFPPRTSDISVVKIVSLKNIHRKLLKLKHELILMKDEVFTSIENKSTDKYIKFSVPILNAKSHKKYFKVNNLNY